MRDVKPNPDCPGCQGRGQFHDEWNWKDNRMDVVNGPCPVCAVSFQTVWNRAAALRDMYSGKPKTPMAAERVEELFLSADGVEYRRLLCWLWNPANSERTNFGDCARRIGASLGGPLMQKARIETRWPDDDTERTILCAVEPKPFAAALKKALTAVERCSRIPVLRQVYITTYLPGTVRVTGTDLEKWETGEVVADVETRTAALAPAHRLYDIARLAPGPMILSRLKDDVFEVRTGRTVYTLVGLPVEDWPRQRTTSEISACDISADVRGATLTAMEV